MKNNYKTEQEEFWAGDFGDDYSKRNVGKKSVSSNLALFSKIFSRCGKIDSLIEFGANIGLNMKAIKLLLPDISLAAVEINPSAVTELNKLGNIDNVHQQSILNFKTDTTWDMTLVKGVLIHINPESLGEVYELLYSCSKKYILVAEYYNPTPVKISYRGNSDKLFKRDFAGEMLDLYPDLKVVDYGFIWRNDPVFPGDDITWFLMEKTGRENCN